MHVIYLQLDSSSPRPARLEDQTGLEAASDLHRRVAATITKGSHNMRESDLDGDQDLMVIKTFTTAS